MGNDPESMFKLRYELRYLLPAANARLFMDKEAC
jgi:hypothetical protein